eukprot:1460341-Rhodomonas_salina.1
MVYGVATQGYASENMWVRSYKVYSYTSSGGWVWVEGGAVFSGNTNRGTLVTRMFTTPIRASLI